MKEYNFNAKVRVNKKKNGKEYYSISIPRSTAKKLDLKKGEKKRFTLDENKQ